MNINFKRLATACAVVLSAGAANAAVIDFTGSKSGAGSGVSLSCAAFGIANYLGCNVTYNSAGLGVNGSPDFQPDQVDGSPIFSSERITLSFAQDMYWDNITFGRWDSNDDARLTAADGASLQYTGNAGSVGLGGYRSNSLTITAYGDVRNDCAYRGCFWLAGNDSFTVASIDVNEVPVPAGLPLVLGGLGMLGWASRKKKKAA